jgi:hypothetical protein
VRFSPIDDCQLYGVEVRHRGKRMVDAVTSRPWMALHDVPYGDYRWTARCLESGSGTTSTESRDGRINRIADASGRVLMPTKAPRNSLDSTGRTYSITYQNRLPAISLRWSNAPTATAFRLEVFDDARGRVFSGQLRRASKGFRSGFFREGSYYWFFRSTGGTKNATSPVTRARITYDNVRPTIHIAEPLNGTAASGSVRVRGTAAVGSTVLVNGVQVQLDGNYRFDQQVPVGSGGLLIFRVTTPGRGTGLYLRHLGR